MIDYWLAFSLGLMGSLHCVGMCGPLVLALPLSSKEKSRIVFQSTVYNMGRVVTYSLMGLVIGTIGWGVALAGYQGIISIVLGGSLILVGVFSISVERHFMRIKFINNFFQKLKQLLSSSLSITGNSSAFKIGMLNGLLPCGLVYVALVGALSTGGYISGSIYMFVFGIGTIPLMIAVMVAGNLKKHLFKGFRKLIPFGLILFGVYLIFRGYAIEVPTEIKSWH